MTKVKINGKIYCVETLIYTVERLTKDVKASAEYHRLVIDKIRAEIINKSNEPNYLHEDEDWSVGLEMALGIIDKYREGAKNETNH